MQKPALTKICRECKEEFSITEFDIDFYQKVDVPQPTLCPRDRQKRRLAYNNETNLYYRTCNFSGEKIVSIYSPDKPYKVYKPEAWWGNEWDAIEYGRDYDFSRPFFEQYAELARAVPRSAVQTNYLLDVNSEFTNYAGSDKNCYLIFHADYNRDCYYGYGVKKCESCVDVFNVFDSELCYECIDCHNCYNLCFSQNSVNCYDSYFLKECIGCRDCLCSKNLRNKQYCIFNKQYTKAEYQQFVSDHPLKSRSELIRLEKQFSEFEQSLPSRHLRMIQTEDSYGDQLFNCRNVVDCYDVAEMRDGRYCYQLYNGANDCMDMYQFGLNAELVYEGSIIGYNANRIRFCHYCTEQIHDLTYCQCCSHSRNLFGCIGLSHKEYCILNKQYSKADYEKLLPRIIAHMTTHKEWGEFFPIEHSTFGYNETTANLYFPLTRQEAMAKGYNWMEEETGARYQGIDYQMHDTIDEVGDDITQAALRCKDSSKPFKIVPQELSFYRRMNLPIPLYRFDERHKRRIAKRNPRELRKTFCTKCSTEMYTSSPTEREAILHCNTCYQEAVI